MSSRITQDRSQPHSTSSSARGRFVRWTVPGAIAAVSAVAIAASACSTQPSSNVAPMNGVPTSVASQAPTLNGLPMPMAGQPGQAQIGVAASPTAAGAPVANGQFVVNCGPGQQALIRPSIVNGQAVSQVDCVAVATAPVGYAQAPYGAAPIQALAQPVAYPQAVGAVQPAPTYVSYPAEAPVVVAPAAARPASTARRTAYRTSGDYVEYQPARRKSGRSWQKSAVIIGSTAGIGAGVGAATGGKKGALIGAAIGGGGAAIWDQVTRRDKNE